MIAMKHLDEREKCVRGSVDAMNWTSGSLAYTPGVRLCGCAAASSVSTNTSARYFVLFSGSLFPFHRVICCGLQMASQNRTDGWSRLMIDHTVWRPQHCRTEVLRRIQRMNASSSARELAPPSRLARRPPPTGPCLLPRSIPPQFLFMALDRHRAQFICTLITIFCCILDSEDKSSCKPYLEEYDLIESKTRQEIM